MLSFLPGTYGTCLIKSHMMHGTFAEMENMGFPSEVVTAIRDSIDANVYFFGHYVNEAAMFAILVGAVVLFTGLFVLFHVFKKTANKG